MSKNPTNFDRGFVKTCVEYKIATVNKVRDYDILTDHKKGLSLAQLAIKYGLTKKSIFTIIHNYD